eukprot:CAMPEP_0206404236 /NCGR_PEP_ID=MMETSP0294-20121207/28236_1 /ASSEMBLY_ACC=CAM_ASM_000327 /TAXON_ID=39354 /ORGANISM="Heterosigma akashiwo, Strain CCMP2393" /LENGTH=55 /DNA_ID=CAMNT_0053862071 /DNA_START=68 /DNA_END=235 /DNA_ORIENTATION=+
MCSGKRVHTSGTAVAGENTSNKFFLAYNQGAAECKKALSPGKLQPPDDVWQQECE